MKPMPNRDRHPRERGAILAFTGIILMTLVGMTVVGVDLGRVAFTATEVQTVAEVAATGYAHSWLQGLATSGDPGDGTCAAEALQVVDGNSIDGQLASASNIEGYERGFYNFDTNGPFSGAVPGGETANAVRATATDTINNFFGAIFGTPQTTVRKTAVASLTCGSRAQTLPLIVQDCQFGGFDGPDDCPNLPQLSQQNIARDNSCWTSLGSSSANTNDIRALIDAQCCATGPGTCNLANYPTVREGQDVTVMNGQSVLITSLQRCWDNGFREFVVPITPCGTMCNQTNRISGFAAIRLLARPIAQGANSQFTLASFCNTDPTQGVGGNCDFGNFKVAMVE
jgi:hypothetical protein